jgi:hypothetical protein
LFFREGVKGELKAANALQKHLQVILEECPSHGDFDGNGYQDTAILIEYGENLSEGLAICLVKKRRVEFYLIEEPSCADYLNVAAKGAKYYDWEDEVKRSYPYDTVGTVCHEKAGTSYLYKSKAQRGWFVPIVGGH